MLEYCGDVLLVSREATHESSPWSNECVETKVIIQRCKNQVTGLKNVSYSVFEKHPNGDRNTLMFGDSGVEAQARFRRIINSLNYPINQYHGE